MFAHILLANDGSPCSLRAADVAASMAECCCAKLTMVYVQAVKPVYSIAELPLCEQYGDIQEENQHSALQAVVDATTPFCRVHHVELNCIEGVGPAGDIIVNAAIANHVDLIVLGHRGHGPVRSFFLGTTSERVVHTAKCSVLIVR